MSNQDPIDITEEFEKINQMKEDTTNKFKKKFEDAVEWCKHNKGAAVTIGLASLELIRQAIRFGCRIYTKQADVRSKDYRCYDTSLGRYWELRKKLTNKDWLEIDRRRSSGERLGDILNDLHVLK